MFNICFISDKDFYHSIPEKAIQNINEDDVISFFTHLNWGSEYWVEETDGFKQELVDDTFSQIYLGRFFISTKGTVLTIWTTHPKLEQYGIKNGILPNYKSNMGCPIFEHMGWIRLCMERAIILNEIVPTFEQYQTIRQWIELCEIKMLSYDIVYPWGVSQESVNPSDFENFKTSTYAIGKIKKWYATH